jgi:hypothetical protein
MSAVSFPLKLKPPTSIPKLGKFLHCQRGFYNERESEQHVKSDEAVGKAVMS